ncbi:tetratricopeptide repeat protein [Marvinbryantia formatexigens]|uniref:tetratricopeptide repeat protein n=1 Tax=Marvinbryantia formatexigens TaxID=168384 RepID=UPI00030AC9E7|nr:tetratricopeptide repeat protein [Marvinbryantia formatexigens]UWO24870.1 tetratricopeptide repeat protein [Marvinbryantia formatexigens DSM 14469]SDG78125.1 TPR repeat-containing protein [Marvinbryantia formatexigens]
MRCIYCGTPLSSIDYCSGCGADVSILKRVVRISNLLYNEGLEKATVRDLSGAVSCLKRSLKFNKENIDARNLLGLVYYETGEVVSALSEWVISKNIMPENNAANLYISRLQSNKNKLDVINQTIRKYNQALQYCRQGDDDMAVMQLKRVLTQNPNLIKGYHLLALVYLKQQEYEKARRLLKKAAQIDATNTTTLRYLNEVEEATGVATNLGRKKYRRQVTPAEPHTEKKFLGPVTYMSGNDTIIQPTTFRDSSSVATFLNIFLGFVLGAALIWFLAIPSNTRKINQSANQQVTDANTKLAAESAQVDALEAEIEGYQAQIDEATQTMEEAQNKADGYDQLLSAAVKFLGGDESGAATELAEVNADSLDGNGKTLYDTIMASVKSTIYTTQYNEGATAYAQGDYATAAEKLAQAVETDDNQYDAWYYLSFAYYNLGDTENADKAFEQTIQKFPAQAQAANLSQYVSDQSVLTSTGNAGTAETNADGTQTAETNADGTPVETNADGTMAETNADGTPVDGTQG